MLNEYGEETTDTFGITQRSDAEIGRLAPLRGPDTAGTRMSGLGTMAKAAQDDYVRSLAYDEELAERFHGNPTAELQDRFEANRLRETARMMLDNQVDYTDEEFGGVFKALSQKFGVFNDKEIASFKIPVGDQEPSNVMFTENFLSFLDEMDAAPTMEDKQKVAFDRSMMSKPELANWMDAQANMSREDQAAYADRMLQLAGADVTDILKEGADALVGITESEDAAWLKTLDPAVREKFLHEKKEHDVMMERLSRNAAHYYYQGGRYVGPEFSKDFRDRMEERNKWIKEQRLIDKYSTRLADERMRAEGMKLVPFLTKGQRDLLNIAASGADMEPFRGAVDAMRKEDREMMYQLIGAFRPEYKGNYFQVLGKKFTQSFSGASRNIGQWWDAWGVEGEEAKELAEKQREDTAWATQVIEGKIKDPEGFWNKAFQGWADSAALQGSAFGGAMAIGYGLKAPNPYVKGAALAAGAVMEGWGWASMCGEQYNNQLMHGVDPDHARSVALYAGTMDFIIENFDFATIANIGGAASKISAAQLKRMGLRGFWGALKGRSFKEISKSAGGNLARVAEITLKENFEELLQGMNREGWLKVSKGEADNLVEAFLRKDTIRQGLHDFADALPTCTLFGITGAADFMGAQRASAQNNLERGLMTIAREKAKRDNGAEFTAVQEADAYTSVLNTMQRAVHAMVGMTRKERNAWLNSQTDMTDTERAAFAAAADYYESVSAQDGEQAAREVISGNIHDAVFSRAGWKVLRNGDGEVTGVKSSTGEVYKIKVVGRTATLADLDQAAREDFVAEYNDKIARAKELVANGEDIIGTPLEGMDKVEPLTVEGLTDADVAKIQGASNDGGITLFQGERRAGLALDQALEEQTKRDEEKRSQGLVGKAVDKVKDALGYRDHTRENLVRLAARFSQSRTTGVLGHEISHQLIKQLEDVIKNRSMSAKERKAAKDQLKALRENMGKDFDETTAERVESIFRDMVFGYAPTVTEVNRRNAVTNFLKAIGKVATAGKYNPTFLPVVVRKDGKVSSVEDIFQSVLAMADESVRRKRELAEAKAKERKEAGEKHKAEREEKRQKKIEMRKAAFQERAREQWESAEQRAEEERKFWEEWEAETQAEIAAEEQAELDAIEAKYEAEFAELERQERETQAEIAAQEKAVAEREAKMLKNRKESAKNPPRLGWFKNQDGETAQRCRAAYMAVWKAKSGKTISQAEVDALGEEYGLPPEALNLKKTKNGYRLQAEQMLSDDALIAFHDALVRFYADVNSVKIIVPDVVVPTVEDAANAMPNEVYDPVSDTFVTGRVVVSEDAKSLREQAGLEEPSVTPAEIEDAKTRHPTRFSISNEPSGRQKDANTEYPDASAEILLMGDTKFSIGKKAREEAISLIKRKRPDLLTEAEVEKTVEEAKKADFLNGVDIPDMSYRAGITMGHDTIDETVDKIGKFETSKEQKAALHWFIKGAIRLPEDAPKVTEAIKYGERAKGKANTDPMSYASPMAMIEALHEFKPKAKPINPDTVAELSDKQVFPEGVTTYLVQDDPQGQLAMRKIINTHWGEDANPWCLLHGDGHGNLSDGTNGGYDAKYYWHHYSALPKRVAFKNGKLLAFMATDEAHQEEDEFIPTEENVPQQYVDEYYASEDAEYTDFDEWMYGNHSDVVTDLANAMGVKETAVEQWWDRQDKSHDGIPLGNMPVPGDKFGRWTNYEIAGGELRQIGGFYKTDAKGNVIRDWFANGFVANEYYGDDGMVSKHWNMNGTPFAIQDLNKRYSIRWDDNGSIEHFSGVTKEEAERIYRENTQTAPRTKFAISPQEDAEYLAAVKRGDMETAQRMVREAFLRAFPNTKIVGKDGLPLVVYHGTDKDFTEFERQGVGARNFDIDGFYFSPDANSYVFGDKNRHAMPVFLNITNPAHGWSERVSDKKSVGRFGKAQTDREYFEQDGLKKLREDGFDGAVRGGYSNGEYIADAMEFIALDATQIKSADPVTYDDAGNVIPLSQRFNPRNPDIRFSIANPVERSGNLIALHNLKESDIRELSSLEGIPAPSIAVVKGEMGHANYGPISFVFASDVIDPQVDERNKAYSGDAWTPTLGNVKIENKVLTDKLQDIIDSLKGQADSDYGKLFDAIASGSLELEIAQSIERGDYYRIAYNHALRLAYLKSKGVEITPLYKEKTIYPNFSNQFLVALDERVGSELEEVWNRGGKDGDRGTIAEMEKILRKAAVEAKNAENPEMNAERKNRGIPTLGERLYGNGIVRPWDMAYALMLYRKDGITQTIDTFAVENNIDDKLSTSDAEYQEWIRNTFAPAVGARGIRNDKDTFTAAGNRRSWESLHDRVTAQRIVDMMYANAENIGNGALGGLGPEGAAVRQYASLDEMRADEDRLRSMPEAEWKELQERTRNNIFSAISQLQSVQDTHHSDNPLIEMDYIKDAILGAFIKADGDYKKYLKAVAKEVSVADEDILRNAWDAMIELREAPTKYFEAKPERVIGFSEIAFAVIPDNTSADIRDIIDGWGVPVTEYQADNKEDRVRVVNKEAGRRGTKFSIRTNPPPRKTGVGYKVFVQKRNPVTGEMELYPPMVANPEGAGTPVGLWLDADEGVRAADSKTGRGKVKAGGKGTNGGGGTLAWRPGWHLGEIPYALQFNVGEKVPNPLGIKNKQGEVIKVGRYFPANFVWAEVEYAADIDYQEEAMSYGRTESGKFNHALAGLPRLPVDGSYTYRTNANPATDPWIITGAMRVTKILTPDEVDAIVREAGREPQERENRKSNTFQGGPVGPGVEGYTRKGETKFSIATYEDGGRDTLVKWMKEEVAKGNLTQKDADDILAETDMIYKFVKQIAESGAMPHFSKWSETTVEIDEDGKPIFGVIRKNGDYVYNIDFSTVCKKRRPMDKVFQRLVSDGVLKRNNLRELTMERVVQIQDIIKRHGMEVACALCFVDSKRYRIGEAVQTFADDYNTLVREYNADPKAFAKTWGDLKKGTEKRRADQVAAWQRENPGKTLSASTRKEVEGGAQAYAKKAQLILADEKSRHEIDAADLFQSDGMARLVRNDPKIFKLFRSHEGAGKIKDAFWDVPYNNDIAMHFKHRTNDDVVEFDRDKAYAVGGVRLQSFSDFVPVMLFDYIQMFAELAAKRLPLHVYTKEADFVKLFAYTGAKINMSLVPTVLFKKDKKGNILKYTQADEDAENELPVKDRRAWVKKDAPVIDESVPFGLGKDGEFIYADECFPVDEAFRLREQHGDRGNVGTIMVGISDAHIRAALRSDKIDQVIPYHSSGINAIVGILRGIFAFTDYQGLDKTRKFNGTDKKGNEIWVPVPKSEELDWYAYLAKYKDAKKAANAYLKWCDKMGYSPRFAEFRDEENYYKLLADFRMYTAKGKYSPLQDVKMKIGEDFDTVITEALQHHEDTEAAYDAAIDSGIIEEIEQTVLQGVGEVRKAKNLAKPKKPSKETTQFSIANKETGNIAAYVLARNIVENGGRAPNARTVKAVADSMHYHGDYSALLANAMAKADETRKVLRYLASDPKTEKLIARAGLTMRNERAIERARQATLQFSREVEEAKAANEKAIQRAVRAVRGEDYESMSNRLGLDFNAILQAIEPKERAQGERSDPEKREPVNLSAEDLKMAEDIARRAVEEGSAAAEKANAEAEANPIETDEDGKRKQKKNPEDIGNTDADEEFGNAFSRAIKRAIANAGITVDNIAGMVKLCEVITEKYIRENPSVDEAFDADDIWSSPIARAMLAANISSFAQAVASEYAPSYARVRIAERCKGLDDKSINSLEAIEQTALAIFADLNRDIVRQSRKSLIKDLHKSIDNLAKHHKQNELNQDRKVTGEVGEWLKMVKKAVDMSAAEVEERSEYLEGILETYGNPTDGKKIDEAMRYRDFAMAYMELGVLDQFGNLKGRMPSEIREAKDYIEQTANEARFEVMMFGEKWNRVREQFAERIKDGIEGDPKNEGRKPEEAGILYSLIGMWETKARQLTRFCSDPVKKARAIQAMERLEEMIQRAEDIHFNYKQMQTVKFIDLCKSAYGGETEAREALSHDLDKSLWAKLDRGDQHSEWTIGKALQMYVSIVQDDYADNVQAWGRDAGYRAFLEEVIKADNEKHMDFIRGLRELYMEQGDHLSEVLMKTCGTRLRTPNLNYMPVKMDNRKARAKKLEARSFSPFAPALTPRVKNGLDFDQDADILDIFFDRLEQTAHTIAYSETGPLVMGICQSDRVLNKIEDAFGDQAMSAWNNYILDIFAGPKSSAPGAEAKPMKTLARWTTLTWLLLNPGSWAKQLSAVPCYALSAQGSFKDVAKSLAYWLKSPMEMARIAHDLSRTKAFQARYGTSISQELKYATGDQGRLATWWQKYVINPGMSGIVGMDKVGVYLLAGVYKARREALENAGRRGEEASELASNWLMHIVDKTAQTARTVNTTQLQRAGGAWNIILQFKSSPVQQTQFELAAFQEWAATGFGLNEQGKRCASAIVINHLMVPFINSIVQYLVTLITSWGEPDEEKRKKLLAMLISNVISGSLGSIVFIGCFIDGLGGILGDAIATGERPNMARSFRGFIPAEGAVTHWFRTGDKALKCLCEIGEKDLTDTAVEMAKALSQLNWLGRTAVKAIESAEEK